MPSEIAQIIADQVPESLRLEFKRSNLINDKKREDICKAISAMANSDGGRVIFGIEEDKVTNSFKLDGGVTTAPRAVEWLDSIVADNISPRIVAVTISHEKLNNAWYLCVSIPRSAAAPHQSPDGRFYKRSNNRSFPMEAYEIDDVRHRRLAGPTPITVNFEVEPNSLARLVIRNRSELVCRNLKISVTGNFPMLAFGNKTHGDVKLSRVGAGQRVEYTLGSTHGIIGAANDAAFEVQGVYFSEGASDPIQISDRISVGELIGSALPHDDVSEKLKKIAEELRGVKDEIRKSNSTLEQMGETFSGSGIRISSLSLHHLKRPEEAAQFSDFKYDAYGLTLQGLAEVLETTTNVVSGLHRALNVLGGNSFLESELSKLPPEAAARAKEKLNFERF